MFLVRVWFQNDVGLGTCTTRSRSREAICAAGLDPNVPAATFRTISNFAVNGPQGTVSFSTFSKISRPNFKPASSVRLVRQKDISLPQKTRMSASRSRCNSVIGKQIQKTRGLVTLLRVWPTRLGFGGSSLLASVHFMQRNRDVDDLQIESRERMFNGQAFLVLLTYEHERNLAYLPRIG